MNGGHTLHWLQFSSNVFFAYLTPVSQSNINFGTAFKLDGHGDGPISCMNFAGLDPATMIASIGSKWCLGKEFPKNMEKWLKFGTFLGALLFGPFGSNGMTKCSTRHNGMNPRLSNKFGMN